MALHAKLQLSARRWRAPLWLVVLPICEWLTGWGGGDTSLPTSIPPPLFLFFPLSISCCTVQSDTWIRLLVTPSVLVCSTQQQQLFICCQQRLKTSPSLHPFLINVCLVCCAVLRGGRHFYLVDFTTRPVKRLISLCHSFSFISPE